MSMDFAFSLTNSELLRFALLCFTNRDSNAANAGNDRVDIL